MNFVVRYIIIYITRDIEESSNMNDNFKKKVYPVGVSSLKQKRFSCLREKAVNSERRFLRAILKLYEDKYRLG